MEPRFAVTEGQHLSEDSDPKPAQEENWKAVNQFQSCWKGRNIFQGKQGAPALETPRRIQGSFRDEAIACPRECMSLLGSGSFISFSRAAYPQSLFLGLLAKGIAEKFWSLLTAQVWLEFWRMSPPPGFHQTLGLSGLLHLQGLHATLYNCQVRTFISQPQKPPSGIQHALSLQNHLTQWVCDLQLLQPYF